MSQLIRKEINPGGYAEIELPFSEVAMHMGVAGTVMIVQLIVSEEGQFCAQLYTDELKRFSAPITIGEAGIYHTRGHDSRPIFYHY
jgi:hypothetical protein